MVVGVVGWLMAVMMLMIVVLCCLEVENGRVTVSCGGSGEVMMKVDGGGGNGVVVVVVVVMPSSCSAGLSFDREDSLRVLMVMVVVLAGCWYYGAGEALLRGTIVNRTYGTHKNLYVPLFLLTIFGPINYSPP